MQFNRVRYGIEVTTCKTGAKGYVAETFITRDSTGKNYFAKVTDRPAFKPAIVNSLPVLQSMHEAGMERAVFSSK